MTVKYCIVRQQQSILCVNETHGDKQWKILSMQL